MFLNTNEAYDEINTGNTNPAVNPAAPSYTDVEVNEIIEDVQVVDTALESLVDLRKIEMVLTKNSVKGISSQSAYLVKKKIAAESKRLGIADTTNTPSLEHFDNHHTRASVTNISLEGIKDFIQGIVVKVITFIKETFKKITAYILNMLDKAQNERRLREQRIIDQELARKDKEIRNTEVTNLLFKKAFYTGKDRIQLSDILDILKNTENLTYFLQDASECFTVALNTLNTQLNKTELLVRDVLFNNNYDSEINFINQSTEIENVKQHLNKAFKKLIEKFATDNIHRSEISKIKLNQRDRVNRSGFMLNGQKIYLIQSIYRHESDVLFLSIAETVVNNESRVLESTFLGGLTKKDIEAINKVNSNILDIQVKNKNEVFNRHVGEFNIFVSRIEKLREQLAKYLNVLPPEPDKHDAIFNINEELKNRLEDINNFIRSFNLLFLNNIKLVDDTNDLTKRFIKYFTSDEEKS